jgi:manganese transport protein
MAENQINGRSLSEVHSSVPVPKGVSFWRRLLAFSGPAYLVSVGYMDPGNWATDIAAGSKFGYALLWVLIMSNIMALLLQNLAARLGIVTQMDLAQACRALYPKKIAFVLWILAEIAIAACDLAEILGSAIGLKLLFGIPILWGVVITALDTFVILLLHSRGIRMMEAFIIVLVTTIGIAMATEVVLSKPVWGEMALGVIPSLKGPGALYLAIGIIGATVMPHNLFLHSSLVQSRQIRRSPGGILSSIKYNFIDSFIALNGAFFVNASLMVLAAATYYRAGYTEVSDIFEAHRLLEPILGTAVAPIVFAVALIASGQSSTITGTLAGQIVMEGFVQFRLTPLVRRMLTRALAIVPAVLVISLMGEKSTGDLLVFSQVVLSLQLSFAVFPLIHLVSDRRWMDEHAIKPLIQILSWMVAALIAGLNIMLVVDAIRSWLKPESGIISVISWVTVVPLSLALLGVLTYVLVQPAVKRWKGAPLKVPVDIHGQSQIPTLNPPPPAKKIGAALDFSEADGAVLSHAISQAKAHGRGAQIILFHIVESGGARFMGSMMEDSEAKKDQERLELYRTELADLGIEADLELGYGAPAEELAKLVRHHSPDLLILGSHGHGIVGDFVHGTTVEKLRHRIAVPVLVVPFSETEKP